MARSRFAVIAGAAMMLGVVLAAAAPRPALLVNAAPGQWEIAGVPGEAPVRQCLSDLIALAQYEHRGQSCSQRILSDSASSAVVEYNCSAAAFGRSKMTAITPRSLRIETQGISDGLPFNYVLQARRVGDCPAKETAAAH